MDDVEREALAVLVDEVDHLMAERFRARRDTSPFLELSVELRAVIADRHDVRVHSRRGQ